MNVAYLGNTRHAWCTETHTTASLEALGHTVTRLQERPMLDWPQVVRDVLAADAQVFIWTRTWDQDRDACLAALGELREAGVPSAFYHLDRWWGLEREYQVGTEPFFRCDVVFSPDGGNDERWAEAGVEHYFMPPGVYGPECRGGRPDHRRWPYDVVFVGTSPYPHREWEPYRAELLARFRERFGKRFAVLPGANPRGVRRPPVRGRDLTNLYATAKVVIGDSCLAGGARRYWSDRIPETLGRGGFLIHPEVEGLGDWYEHGADLVTYPVGDFDAAVDAAEHYLAHADEREAIRAHGQATVLGRDTYEHRMGEVLRVVTDRFGVRPVRPKPVRVTHARSRQSATFTLAEGHTDAIAVQEVWANDDYRLVSTSVRGETVVDVGANVGAFSVLAAKLGAAIVMAYEPHPANYAALAANLAANQVMPRVVASPAAVGRAGATGFVSVAGEGGGAHTFAADEGVPVIGIDEAIPDAEVALLKIDCEGGEYEIFAGNVAWLARVRAIAMEFHGPGLPHLHHLDDGSHLERWGAMVAALADHGRVETFGHPRTGGLLYWRRY